MSEKLHKILASLGLGSRRDMEECIKSGRVSVDGKVAALGDRVGDHEVIRFDGRIIRNAQTEKPICRVLMYNKPEGQMCTASDPQGRPTVFDRLPKIAKGRWLYIGRLDVNTSGLLLFTTDGELANALMHPSHEVERVYAVRVFGEVAKEHIKQLETNVQLEDGPAHFEKVIYIGGEGMNQWYQVVLREGRKREVRRLWEQLGFKVSRLKRIKYGTVELGKLPQGGYEELSLAEVNKLRQLAGLKPEKKSVLKEDAKPLTSREEFVKNRQIRNTARKYAQQGNTDARFANKRRDRQNESRNKGFSSMYVKELDLSNFSSMYADIPGAQRARTSSKGNFTANGSRISFRTRNESDNTRGRNERFANDRFTKSRFNEEDKSSSYSSKRTGRTFGKNYGANDEFSLTEKNNRHSFNRSHLRDDARSNGRFGAKASTRGNGRFNSKGRSGFFNAQ